MHIQLRTLALILTILSLLCAAASAESSSGYTLPFESGSLHSLVFLAGGDIFTVGSYDGRQTLEGEPADTTIARLKPDGSIVWAYDLPNNSEIGGSGLVTLSGDRYMVVHPMGEGELRAFFFNPEEGMLFDTAVPPEELYFAVEDGLITFSQKGAEGCFRLRWLDEKGQELRFLDFPSKSPETTGVNLLETGDALYMVSSTWDRAEPTALQKLSLDGAVKWRKEFETKSHSVDVCLPDGEGGVILLITTGGYDEETLYPYIAMRLDADGNTLWEREIDAGKYFIREEIATGDELRMLWHARDTFQLMTLGYDGVLTEGPLYANPATLEEDAENASCVVSLATDTNGEAWMFYTMVWNEGERVVPYIRPLSAFALQ